MTIFADAREISPDDRYLLGEGEVFMTGTQALVRVIIDQMRADRAAGLRTGTMVSGYPGSPLGGFDQELARSRHHTEPLGVVHRPGQNEELGATSVWGSQLVPALPRPRTSGVLGVWYGKAPGVDRAADAFPARQLRRRPPRGRPDRALRRRPDLQVLHPPLGDRGHARHAGHAGRPPRQRPGAARPGTPRDRGVPGQRPVGRGEGRLQRRGRHRHRERRA
ncbi:hypothetical protein GCM10018952_33700 [Streptosporangium vulgare]